MQIIILLICALFCSCSDDRRVTSAQDTKHCVNSVFVPWSIEEGTLTLGKFEILVGYEEVEAPDLWRSGTDIIKAAENHNDSKVDTTNK